MPARTGQQYLSGLRERSAEVYISGKRVDDVTTHPSLRNGAASVAALYDMQYQDGLQDEMTYVSPTSGEPVGLSFITPRTHDDLERRHAMMSHWAQASCGMMGRSPDFMNVTFMAMAAAGDFFAQETSPNSRTTSRATTSTSVRTTLPSPTRWSISSATARPWPRPSSTAPTSP